MRNPRSRSTLLVPLAIPPILILSAMASTVPTGISATPSPWIASSRYARKANPIKATPASIANGERLYAAQCLACHGKDGKGNGERAGELDPRPKDLTDPSFWLQSDGELFYKTSKGRTPMPAFNKLLSDEEVWHTINYIRTLAPKPAVLGSRFDVGIAATGALADTLAPAIRLTSAIADEDTEQIEAALRDLNSACASLKAIALTGQDKAIVRRWKSAASRLASQAAALESAPDPQAQSIALSRFSQALANALLQFGGVKSGRVYQLETPASDGSNTVWTWIQGDPTPHSPFPISESTKPAVVAVFGT